MYLTIINMESSYVTDFCVLECIFCALKTQSDKTDETLSDWGFTPHPTGNGGALDAPQTT